MATYKTTSSMSASGRLATIELTWLNVLLNGRFTIHSGLSESRNKCDVNQITSVLDVFKYEPLIQVDFFMVLSSD